MKRIFIKDLLRKYLNGQCTEEETRWIENWYIQQDNKDPLPITKEEFNKDLQILFAKLNKKDIKSPKLDLVKVAACLAGLCLLSIYFWPSDEPIQLNPQQAMNQEVDIVAPFENKAILFLSRGQKISLDQVQIGNTIEDQNLSLIKTTEKELNYSRKEHNLTKNIFHELITLTGGQYQLELIDGTKVWLNAASRLRYQIPFNPNARVVELSGEAYFEVAKNNTPFYVQTPSQTIEVLGTHFNVNAYHDQPLVKTTLLEGSIKVNMLQPSPSFASEIILSSGEQAVLENGSLNKILLNDPLQTIAWKQGLFSFQGESLSIVMKEFSRWYGVSVKFDGELPQTRLWGQVYRNASASEALKILEFFGLKFRISKKMGVSRIEISEK